MDLGIEEMVVEVSKLVDPSIGSDTIELVLRSYLEAKRREILKGNSISEEGIGKLRPGWRKVSNAFNPKVPFTAKMITDIDGDLKQSLINKLCSDATFRANVGAEEL